MSRPCLPRVLDRGPEPSGPSAAGFSLIEVMIAVVLLAVAMLAIGAAQLTSLRYAADADNRSQAMYLAEEQMSRFMVMNDSDPALLADGGDGPIVLADEAADVANSAGVGETMQFQRSWTIELPPVPGLPVGSSLRRITVRVSWGEGIPAPGSFRSVSLVGVRR